MARSILTLGLLLLAAVASATSWDREQTRAVLALDVGARIEVAVPDGAGRARTALLERIDIYARDARILVVGADGEREIPRSRHLSFIAREGGPLALSIDPDSGSLSGGAWVDGELFELTGERLSDGSLRLALRAMPTHAEDGGPIEWSCGGAMQGQSSLQDDLSKLAEALAGSAEVQGSGSRQAVVAVDTDNEFMNLKFGNNATNANNYIAALFTLMNGMYENPPASGGLDLRLVQGHTILRPSTVPDPYNVNLSPAQGANLSEFSEHWRVTFPAIDRAFAMLLSGKSSSANSSSGIAWLLTSGNYCAAKGTQFGNPVQTFGHYSVTQVFRFGGSTAASDLRVIAHELGHNFGAHHSHCTAVGGAAPTGTGTMDQCFSGETVGATACYSGSVSCPGGPGNPGTIMSYCHFNPPNCGQAQLQFHPGHVTTLSARIAANFPGCITPVVPAEPPLFANGFEAL